MNTLIHVNQRCEYAVALKKINLYNEVYKSIINYTKHILIRVETRTAIAFI